MRHVSTIAVSLLAIHFSIAAERDVIKLDIGVNQPDYVCYRPVQLKVSGSKKSREKLDPTRRGDSYNDHFQVIADDRRNLMYAFWTQASWEGAGDSHIAFSKSADRGRSWSAPTVLAGGETRSDPRPRAAWQQPMLAKGGRLYVLWNQQTTKSASQVCGEMFGRYSDDAGETWSDPEKVPFTSRMDADPADAAVPPSWCNWQRPLRLGEGGRFFVGCTRHGRAPYDRAPSSKVEFWQFENIDANPSVRDVAISYFANNRMALSAEGVERQGGYVASGPALEEASVVKLPDGGLFALMRSSVGYPLWSISRDGGRTWSAPSILRDDEGIPYLHPRSPCPLYDWKGCEAGSGMYFALIHNRFDFSDTSRSAYRIRGPLYLIAGRYDPGSEQPIRFGRPRLFSPRNAGNSFYSSYTVVDGEGVIWFPDRKYYLLGRKVGPEWFEDDGPGRF